MTETKNIISGEEWNSFLEDKTFSTYVVLTDENTSVYCLESFLIQYRLPSFIEIQIKSGEANKGLSQVEFIWNRMLHSNVDRDALVICLGGGIVCDIGAFAASTYKRGINFIHVPTTNLAMTDAAIGGKNGVNYFGIKNQIGTFQLPLALVIAPSLLKTLPERELRAGHAETLKHALISGQRFWQELKEIKSFVDLDLIQKSMAVKQNLVVQDFKDKGIRQSLNFGHTVGHGIESSALKTSYPLLHGEAIAIGMIVEAKLAMKYCGLSAPAVREIEQCIKEAIPVYIHPDLNANDCLYWMKQDKKNKNGQIVCSLISEIGVPVIEVEVTASDILAAMIETFESWEA